MKTSRKLLDHNQIKHNKNQSSNRSSDTNIPKLGGSISVTQIENSSNIWLAKSKPGSNLMSQTIDGSLRVHIERKKSIKETPRPKTSINIIRMDANEPTESIYSFKLDI